MKIGKRTICLEEPAFIKTIAGKILWKVFSLEVRYRGWFVAAWFIGYRPHNNRWSVLIATD